MSLWESVRRLCAICDTVVQYAAYSTSSSSRANEGTVSFDSDYSGEAGRSLFFLSGMCIFVLRKEQRILLTAFLWCQIPTMRTCNVIISRNSTKQSRFCSLKHDIRSQRVFSALHDVFPRVHKTTLLEEEDAARFSLNI